MFLYRRKHTHENLTDLLAWTLIVLALTTIQSLSQMTYEPYIFTIQPRFWQIPFHFSH